VRKVLVLMLAFIKGEGKQGSCGGGSPESEGDGAIVVEGSHCPSKGPGASRKPGGEKVKDWKRDMPVEQL